MTMNKDNIDGYMFIKIKLSRSRTTTMIVSCFKMSVIHSYINTDLQHDSFINHHLRTMRRTRRGAVRRDARPSRFNKLDIASVFFLPLSFARSLRCCPSRTLHSIDYNTHTRTHQRMIITCKSAFALILALELEGRSFVKVGRDPCINSTRAPYF